MNDILSEERRDPRPSGSPTSGERPPWSPTAERIAVAAFWLFLAALEVLRRTVNPFRPPSQFGFVAYVGAATYIVWAFLTPFIFSLSRRFPIERGAAARRLITLGAIGIAVAVLIELANFAVLQALIDPEATGRAGRPPFRLPWTAVIVRLWFLDELVIYLAVLAVGFARGYFVRLRAREREAAEFQAEAANLQAQLSDARLSALQMQLNPHFLFNTLHSISSMADEDPAGVQRMVARLSALLRRALESATRQEVPLREELTFLRDYLEIQRIRFLGRLQVTEEIGNDLHDALVPNLILQPIVENAVRYSADQEKDGAGRIALGAARRGTKLVLTVRDNGPGLPEEGAEREGGVGLANTRARLDVLYGSEASLDLRNAPDGGLIATITLPYHTGADIRTAPVD